MYGAEEDSIVEVLKIFYFGHLFNVVEQSDSPSIVVKKCTIVATVFYMILSQTTQLSLCRKKIWTNIPFWGIYKCITIGESLEIFLYNVSQ